MHPPSRETRRKILRALADALGARAPARVYPQGLPPVNVLGPCTNVVFKRAAPILR
jgi:hypothetical protein